MGKAEITRKFDEIVDFAEFKKFLDTPVKRYSSGMYVQLVVHQGNFDALDEIYYSLLITPTRHFWVGRPLAFAVAAHLAIFCWEIVIEAALTIPELLRCR
jgi:hypothetical protein